MISVDIFAKLVRVVAFVAVFFFLMIRLPPRSTLDRSSAASDVYKRQHYYCMRMLALLQFTKVLKGLVWVDRMACHKSLVSLSLIHISEPTRPY